jgi:hypothetical protein
VRAFECRDEERSRLGNHEILNHADPVVEHLRLVNFVHPLVNA